MKLRRTRVGMLTVATCAATGCGGTSPTLAPTDASQTPLPTTIEITPDEPQPVPTASDSAVTVPIGQSGTSQSLIDQLSQINITDEHDQSGYDRDDWPHWVDLNESGCDTRKDVLRQQLIATDATASADDCAISTGLWYSSYDDTFVTVASDLEIDHIVALREAFESGAFSWDKQTRRDFANDTRNLVAITRSANRSKSDNDVADWRPPEHAWCAVSTRIIDVKFRYALSVDRDEHGALLEMIATCDSPTQRDLGEPASLPTSTTTPSRQSSDSPATTTQPPNPGNTKNCSDFATYVEAKTWFDRYFPAYGDVAKLDGDGDGEPCESLP